MLLSVYNRGGSLSGGGGVSDHGVLTGLADDDHTQYTKVDGTRAFTGQQQFVNGDATTPGVHWGGSVGIYRSSDNIVQRASSFQWNIGGTLRFTCSTSVCGPINDAASSMKLGSDTERWGDAYFGTAHFNSISVYTGSQTLAAGDTWTVWDGTNLTATLPANPDNGRKVVCYNRNTTALTVAATAGDTLDNNSSLLTGQASFYVFRKSTRTWYGFAGI
jgi:hypothetical protein